MFHTYVAKCFIWMLHMFCNGFFKCFHVFFASILDTCFKYFICLQTYVAKYFIWMFHKQIRCCIFLLTFCCLASVSPPPPGLVWTSVKQRGKQLPAWASGRHPVRLDFRAPASLFFPQNLALLACGGWDIISRMLVWPNYFRPCIQHRKSISRKSVSQKMSRLLRNRSIDVQGII
jgi:hypothetical protein